MIKKPFFIYNFNFDISAIFQIRNKHEFDKSIKYLANYKTISDFTTLNSGYYYKINENTIAKIINKSYKLQLNYIKFTRNCYIIDNNSKNNKNDNNEINIVTEYFHTANNGTTLVTSAHHNIIDNKNIIEIENKLKFDLLIYATNLNQFLYLFYPKVLINESNLIQRPVQQILGFIIEKIKKSSDKYKLINIKMQNKGEEIVVYLKKNNTINIRIFMVKLSNISTYVLLSNITNKINEVRNIKLLCRYILKRIKQILEKDIIRE